MRYIMKGGVWKNSQDQILKAAIMKYGLNQWSRISSLLQRKSAKQCKQRWYQWLDPSIKKSQWSRAEDQKLLQLARVFPSQWRTIAPFVGRTPMQCFQRYEKLLDMAQGKSSQQTEQLKKLRPGQIDPNPETKPAKLDPIDMDQDEKEMLAEVRVRLANTKGKKAKRKQRQKIIQQARRLAQLQKIRQLDMAGVDNIPTQKQIKRMRQKQDINYNKQIPFKREVPEFVYKLEESQAQKNSSQYASVISLQTLEGKRRDVQEQLQRKLDKKRLKKLKDRDFQSLVKLKNNFQMPAAQPINLPQPQLNQKDLEDMKKYNITTPINSLMMANSSNTPYGMTPQNKILLSARVNYSLNHRNMAMTPIGQDRQEEIYQKQKGLREDQQIQGVDQLSYLKNVQRQEKDPNNKLRSVDRIISQRIKTPSGSQWQQDPNRVKSLFKNLRRPENQIEFQIPQEDIQQSQNQEENQKPLDYQQRQRLQLQQEKRLQQLKLQLMSMAVKQQLPRPLKIPSNLYQSQIQDETSKMIQKMVNNQILSLLFNDALQYPLQSCEFPQNNEILPLAALTNQQLQSARGLIQEQYSSMEIKQEQLLQHYNKIKSSLNHNHKNKKTTIKQRPLTQKQKIQQEYQRMRLNLPLYKTQQAETNKLQKKVKKYLNGYNILISRKIDEINDLQNQLLELHTTKKVLTEFEIHQKNIMGKRLQQLQKYYKLVYDSI